MCACVLGEGRMGVKVRKKRRQRQTKEKSEEKGVGIGQEQFLQIFLPKPHHSTLRDLLLP